MKHLKTFESFNGEKIDEIFGQKFFTGHANTEEKNAAKAKIEADIDTMLNKSTYKFDKEKYKQTLLQKATEDNWKGTIVMGDAANGKGTYPVYQKGKSGFQATAGAMQAGTEVMGSY